MARGLRAGLMRDIGNDTFVVLGTPAGSHVTLKGGDGNDNFLIGGFAPLRPAR